MQESEEVQCCWSLEVKGMAVGQGDVAPPLKAGETSKDKSRGDPEAHGLA